MSRISRNLNFKEVRIQESDHEYLNKMKFNSAEQLDAVLHRILGEYRNSEIGDANFMYMEQVKTTQFWMHRYNELLEKTQMKLEYVVTSGR